MTWVVEFFRRRVNADFKGHSLRVNTHLMAFLRSMRLFTKFLSDTTISYEVVREDSEFTEYCRGKGEKGGPQPGGHLLFLGPHLFQFDFANNSTLPFHRKVLRVVFFSLPNSGLVSSTTK